MGLGVSLILIAAGAILAWAVDVSTSGFNLNTIGYILLVVGIVGALLSHGRRETMPRDRPAILRPAPATRSSW